MSIATSETLGTDQIVLGATSAGNGVYVYAQDLSSAWQLQQTITPPPSTGGSFAKTVATSGDAILVSDQDYTDPTFYAGAAHLYLRTGSSWADPPVRHTLQPVDVEGFDNYGRSVGLDGVHAIVGSLVDYAPSHGKVLFYGVGPDSDGDGIGDACDICPFVPNGPLVSTCIAGAVTPCEQNAHCDTSPGSLDGQCSEALGVCVAGLSQVCTADADCDSGVGTGDGVCAAEQFDVCDASYRVADELLPPGRPEYADAVPSTYALAEVFPPERAFYYDKVYCVSGTPANCSQWEGRWFVSEPGEMEIQWKNAGGQPVGDPVTYVALDRAATPPDEATYAVDGVQYLRNWVQVGAGAPVTIDTNFTLTIQYNTTFLYNNPPVTPSDVHVTANAVQTTTTKTGRIVFQYTDGPNGRLVGFEVVDIRNFPTPSAVPVDVGRRLDIPPGADCKARFITNAQLGGFPAAWQRTEAPLEVWPIRPEGSAANFVVGWYEVAAFTGNCWHHSIRRFMFNWPADPQPFVVDAGEHDPSIVELPVGDGDTYCQAAVVYPGPFDGPRAVINGGNRFSADLPGFAVVRFDVQDDQPGATCFANRVDVKFEVILAQDRQAPYFEVTGEGVYEGEFDAPIGKQLAHPLHHPDTPLYPFGYRYSGGPFAEEIYNETRQIFPVNSSDVHGLMEVWWFEEGAYAPKTHWPFRVGRYNAHWPVGLDAGDPIIIASRSGAGEYPPRSLIYHLGTPGGPQTLNGWNPNDEHSILLPIAGSLRAFAVRDDNPWDVTSGHPHTIVQYPEMRCAEDDNLCIDEGDCGAGQTCDPTGLWRMGVHRVIAEQSPYFFDYTEFPNQADPSEPLPVVAGLPIDPLFPVNFGAAACLL